MNLDHIPHPRVEDHPYIRALIANQQKKVNDRNYHRNRIKELSERDEEIDKAHNMVLQNFWCDKCKQDFKATAVKQVQQDWNAEQRIAFYQTKCFNGHWCIRLITDKFKDGFNVKSKLLSLDRGNHFNDIVQSYEENYNLLYGKK